MICRVLSLSRLSTFLLAFLLASLLQVGKVAYAQTNTPAPNTPVPSGSTPTSSFNQGTATVRPTLSAGSGCPPVGSVDWDNVTDEYALYCTRCEPSLHTATPRAFPTGGVFPTVVLPTGSVPGQLTAFPTATNTPTRTPTSVFTLTPSATPGWVPYLFTVDNAGTFPITNLITTGAVDSSQGYASPPSIRATGAIPVVYAGGLSIGAQVRFTVPAWATSGVRFMSFYMRAADYGSSPNTYMEWEIFTAGGVRRGTAWRTLGPQPAGWVWSGTSAFGSPGNITMLPGERIEIRFGTYRNHASNFAYGDLFEFWILDNPPSTATATPSPTATSTAINFGAFNTPAPVGLRDCTVPQYRNSTPVVDVGDLGVQEYACYRIVPEFPDFYIPGQSEPLQVPGVDLCVTYVNLPGIRVLDVQIPVAELLMVAVVIFLVRLIRSF